MTMTENPDAHSPVVPVISRNRAPGGCDIVVGDVHGCFRTLERALGEIAFDPARDRLFGVGDLINRGPHSADALEWLESRFEAVTLGNHDVAVRSWFRSKLLNVPEEAEGWLCGIPPSDYRRWWDALASLPPALTIETDHGPIGAVHAEAPDLDWDRAVELLETGVDEAYGIALLGHDTREDQDAARARPVKGLRALVHGHWPVEKVAPILNRWNIDTGAGTGRRQRLSLLEVNAPEMQAWTLDVDER